jgi:hypothetical protein
MHIFNSQFDHFQNLKTDVRKFPKLPKYFSNIGIFPECKILEKQIQPFIVCPKPLRYHKNSKTPKKNFKHPGETFSGIIPNMTNVLGSMRKTLCFSKLPKPFA